MLLGWFALIAQLALALAFGVVLFGFRLSETGYKVAGQTFSVPLALSDPSSLLGSAGTSSLRL